jgi:hypothetical protein
MYTCTHSCNSQELHAARNLVAVGLNPANSFRVLAMFAATISSLHAVFQNRENGLLFLPANTTLANPAMA